MSLVNAASPEEEGDEGESEDERKMSPEEVKENAAFLVYFRETVTENCLEPRIGKDAAGKVSFLVGGKAIARVHEDDFRFMFQWITGQKGNDGLDKFRRRKKGRTSTRKSRRKALPSRPAEPAVGQSATA